MKMKRSKCMALILLFLFFWQSLLPQAVLAETKLGLPKEPRVKAQAAVSYDAVKDEVILEKSMNEKMFPASITKLMTALLLAENVKPDADLVITEAALEAPAFAINKNLYILYPEDTIRADDCMKAVLLPSANDMAVVAAEAVAGNVPEFVAMMNKKAKDLGMKNTNFENPTGLHDANHYSTAYDIALLTKAAYANEWVRETMSTLEADIRTENQPVGIIKNSNLLLGKEGNVGGKTGFTEEAGRCLTSVYVRDNREIIQVLLNDGATIGSEQVFVDMKNMANEAFAMKKEAFIPAGTPVDDLVVDYQVYRWFGSKKSVKLSGVTKDPILLYNNTLNNSKVPLKTASKLKDKLNPFALSQGKEVGTFSLTTPTGQILSTPVLSNTTTSKSILMPNIVYYLVLGLGLLLLLGILALILIYRHRNTPQARQKRRAKRQLQRRRNLRSNRRRP